MDGDRGVSRDAAATPTARMRTSHRGLLTDVPRARGRAVVDAVIVPASRPPYALMPSVLLAAELRCPLIALCSYDAPPAAIEAAAAARGVTVHAIDMRTVRAHPPLATTAVLRGTEFDRRPDTPRKRNVGLMIAHMAGWRRFLFLDDDIYGLQAEAVKRAARLLDRFDVVGLENVGFPDNSVVCHANRDADGRQDTFIGGGAMLCSASSVPSLFPDVYNEDWFFLLDGRGIRRCAVHGAFAQISFDPYAKPTRAASEEFGDCLAEGLFALLDDGQPLTAAGRSYWEHFLRERAAFIDGILRRLPAAGVTDQHRERIETSLLVARSSLQRITPALCTDFLTAWQLDRARWRRRVRTWPTGLTLPDALARLTVRDGG